MVRLPAIYCAITGQESFCLPEYAHHGNWKRLLQITMRGEFHSTSPFFAFMLLALCDLFFLVVFYMVIAS